MMIIRPLGIGNTTRYGLMMLRYAISEQENDFDPEYENSKYSNTGYW